MVGGDDQIRRKWQHTCGRNKGREHRSTRFGGAQKTAGRESQNCGVGGIHGPVEELTAYIAPVLEVERR